MFVLPPPDELACSICVTWVTRGGLIYLTRVLLLTNWWSVIQTSSDMSFDKTSIAIKSHVHENLLPTHLWRLEHSPALHLLGGGGNAGKRELARDVINTQTVTSLTINLWRHQHSSCDVINIQPVTSLTINLWRHQHSPARGKWNALHVIVVLTSLHCTIAISYESNG